MIQPSQSHPKEDYDRYVAKATILIHAPETTKSIQDMLTGPDPVQRVADAAVMIMQRVDTASRQAGIEVQDTVKMFCANQIVKLIIELGEAAGKFKFDDDLELLAVSVASQDYVKGEVAAKRIDPAQLKVMREKEMRLAPPKFRKEMMDSQSKIQATARRYNHGKGMEVGADEMSEPTQEPPAQEATEAPPAQPAPSGLIAQAQG